MHQALRNGRPRPDPRKKADRRNGVNTCSVVSRRKFVPRHRDQPLLRKPLHPDVPTALNRDEAASQRIPEIWDTGHANGTPGETLP